MKEYGRRCAALRIVLSPPAIVFARRLFSDATLGLSAEEARVLRSVQMSNRSIYGDRYAEVKRYWRRNDAQMLAFFVRCGWPFSKRLWRSLMGRFESRTGPAELARTYAETAFHYAVELMLGMHRGEWLLPFLGAITAEYPPGAPLRALDYGCGVSDMGLILAQRGAEVTILDLDNSKLDFAEWRYRVRALPCRTIRVADTETTPELPASAYDLVIATEILEHVRDPLRVLANLCAALKPGGLFLCSLGESFEREVCGDHLREAVAKGQSREYQELFRQCLEPAPIADAFPWLFRRRPASALSDRD